MNSYPAFTRQYHIQLANMERLSGVDQSTKQKVENLLSYIEIAQGTIERMSTDKFQILTDEQCKQRNRSAIVEIQQRIARHYFEIDELLQTVIAA